MLRYIALRIAAAVPLLLGVLTLTFLLVEAAPGNASDLFLGDRPLPPEARRRIEAAYGLDLPPAQRYVHWLSSVALHGELGWSISRSRPVADVVSEALPRTVALAGMALIFQLIAGTGIALLCAWRRGRVLDRALSALNLALYATPTFWLGLMAILALCYAVPLFPPSSTHSIGAEGWPAARRLADFAWHLALPSAVLGIASAGPLARHLRAGIVGALDESYVRAARARGVGPVRVLLAHALRNGLLPTLGVLGASLPVLVSGSLVTEVVFAWPGMGRVAYDAILAKDLPAILATTLLASALVVAGGLVADLAAGLVDPRVRLASDRGTS